MQLPAGKDQKFKTIVYVFLYNFSVTASLNKNIHFKNKMMRLLNIKTTMCQVRVFAYLITLKITHCIEVL